MMMRVPWQANGPRFFARVAALAFLLAAAFPCVPAVAGPLVLPSPTVTDAIYNSWISLEHFAMPPQLIANPDKKVPLALSLTWGPTDGSTEILPGATFNNFKVVAQAITDTPPATAESRAGSIAQIFVKATSVAALVPPVPPIPVTITYKGTFVPAGTNNGPSGVGASALGRVGTGNIFNRFYYECHWNEGGVRICSGSPGFTETDAFMLSLGEEIRITMDGYATAGITPTSGDFSVASMSVVVDPIIEIDPSYPYRDQIQFLASANAFSAPTSVPEPGAALLLGAGLAGFGAAAWGWRRRP